MLTGTAAVATAKAGPLPETGDDAELINMCRRFAEANLEDWYRYVVTDDEDTYFDTPPDFDALNLIGVTPATTPEGWQAKALAYSTWNREAYGDFDQRPEHDAPLLAGLLQDMVAPTRDAIVRQLAAQYGPLPPEYTEEGVRTGPAKDTVEASEIVA